MTNSLNRNQAIRLGIVVSAALIIGGYGLARIAEKQGFWSDSIEIEVGFDEVHDVSLGTPVRIRGLDAGQVVRVSYPDVDRPGAEVMLHLSVQSRFANRIYADATAQIYSTGVFGSKVVAISPGLPTSGPLVTFRIRGVKSYGVDEAIAEVRELAGGVKETVGEIKKLASDARSTSSEARGLIQDLRSSEGTLPKLLKNDDLYRDIKEIAGDAKLLIKRTDKAVGTVENEMAGLKGFVNDGRDTLRSVKQGTDAISKLPVIRSYVEDANALLIRPSQRRERMTYNVADLFEPGTSILTDAGKNHLGAVVNWLKSSKIDKSDVVIVAYADLENKDLTPASALEITRKQSEAVLDFLKANGTHKMGWWSSRKMTALGMGTAQPPVVEKEALPIANLQVILFTP